METAISDGFKADCEEIAERMRKIMLASNDTAQVVAAARLRFEVLSGIEHERINRVREEEYRARIEEWKAANPIKAAEVGPWGYPPL